MKIQKQELLHADPLQAHQEQSNDGIVAANWQPTFNINQNKILSKLDKQTFNKPKRGSVPHHESQINTLTDTNGSKCKGS